MEVSKQEFLHIIQDSEQRIQHLCRAYIDREEERKDLYQEIIIQIWHSLPTFKDDAKLSTWIYRIAINTAISHVRKRKAREDYYKAYKKEQQAKEKSNYGQDNTENREEQIAALYRAISELNASEKAVISMYLEEFSYADIAYAMDISENYVGVKLNRIKKKLAERMGDRYGTG